MVAANPARTYNDDVTNFNRAIASLLPLTPRFIVGMVARHYIAGETLEEACDCVRELNGAGMRASLDLLGEFATDASQTRTYVDQVLELIDAIDQQSLDANISIKPTQFGLGIDPGLCEANIEILLKRAGRYGNWIRIDMENSPFTDSTLELYRSLRGRGLDNTGIVLQACLRRSMNDITTLASLKPRVRVCKGIYVERAEIAYHDPREIRDNYARMCRACWETGCTVGIATHDEWCIEAAEAIIQELDIPRERYEFQMLLGVREQLRDSIVAEGHPLRVYVPFGSEWYRYSVRRLRENPSVAGHVFRATLGLGKK